jgi:hypothetical protein
MASTAPTRFDVQPGDDLGRIALAATIDRLDEQGDNISRVDWLYASTNRRALFCRAYLPAITTSSAAFLDFGRSLCRLSTSREDFTITTLADDAKIRVQVYSYSAGTLLATGTATHASGGATVQTTAITGITTTELYLVIGVSKNTTTATLNTITIIEDPLTTLP